MRREDRSSTSFFALSQTSAGKWLRPLTLNDHATRVLLASAKSRPFENASPLPMAATIALEMIGPIQRMIRSIVNEVLAAGRV
jgi:hypothetical protein